MCNSILQVPKYYRRLNDYFPSEEMKHPQQLQELVEDQPYYHKLETDDYLLLYAEFSDCLFVDYLLVDSSIRGKGIGSKVLRKLQQRKLPIILEVEESDPSQPDTIARRRFYGRHGFKFSPGVQYRRKDKQGVPFQMDILYWSPVDAPISDKKVLHMMSKVCRAVHNHNAMAYYDRLPADPERVLSLRDA
jgi:GNAT superfamily N-acetyltransferase